MARFASIDLGTNTFRMLIVEPQAGSLFHVVYTENRMTRLGEGFSERKDITAAALKRSIASLRHFRNLCDEMQVDHVLVFGTSALRQAENRSAFLKEVKQETGFEVEVLSGEEEAYYTLMGVNLIFEDQQKINDPMVLIDIGGGSTEFIVSRQNQPEFLLSTDLGAVTLTERFLHTDPPLPEALAELTHEVKKKLLSLSMPLPQEGLFVGTAGTVTSLAAMAMGLSRYDPQKINRFVLEKNIIENQFEIMIQNPLSEWENLPGLEKGRADILIAGILILRSIMDTFGYDKIIVSDYGLREGVLVSRFKDQFQQGKR